MVLQSFLELVLVLQSVFAVGTVWGWLNGKPNGHWADFSFHESRFVGFPESGGFCSWVLYGQQKTASCLRNPQFPLVQALLASTIAPLTCVWAFYGKHLRGFHGYAPDDTRLRAIATNSESSNEKHNGAIPHVQLVPPVWLLIDHRLASVEMLSTTLFVAQEHLWRLFDGISGRFRRRSNYRILPPVLLGVAFGTGVKNGRYLERGASIWLPFPPPPRWMEYPE